MEKQYSGSCNDAIITAYVPVYSAALLSLLPTLSGRKQLFVSNIIISVCMRTLSFWLCLFLLFPLLHAQDAELKMYQDELARALRLKNRDSIAAAYCHLGEYYAYRQSDSTRYYCDKGLEYARKDVPEPYLTLLINRVETYSALGDMESAIDGYLKVLDEAERFTGVEDQVITTLTSLGVNYRRKDMPDSALIYYNRALEKLEGRKSYDERVHLLTNMAVLYANTSRLKEAENYVRAAVEESKKCDDMDMVLYAASTAGGIMTLQKKYDEAAQMLYPALAMAREQKKPKFVLKSITYLLNAYFRMNNNDSINHYIREAEKMMAELPESSGEVLGYKETLFKILNKMGRYRESLSIQQQMLRAMDVNAQTPIDKLYLEMARNYHGLKDYPHAADYYEKAYWTSDSLHQTEVDAELSELSMKYENQVKELEIARLTQVQLEQKAKTMQWGIVAAVAVSAFLLLVFYYMFRQKRVKKEEELKLAKSYIDGLERERTRLAKELHDGVCNDLLGIGMQVQCMPPSAESKHELLDLLEQVRGEVRCISHELMPPKFQYVTLAETIEAYIERLVIPASMQLAFSKENDHAEWGQVPEQTAYEVYRILQELLSNILKHSEATEVNINLSLSKELLVLLITDNGKPFSDSGTAMGGIGLNTTQERAKAIGGSLSVNCKGSIQQFQLEIPLSL